MARFRVAFLVSIAVVAVLPAQAHAVAAPAAARATPAASNEAAHWSATNYRPSSAATVARAAPVRRVVISGYHPVEGFEAEMAAEQITRHRSETAAAASEAEPVD